MRKAQTSLPDFRDERQVMISDYSSIIVKKLTDEYEDIIDSMILSDNAKAQYKYKATTFIHFIMANGIHSDTFLDFRSTVESLKTSVSTKKVLMAAAKKLLKEAHRRGILPVDITGGVPSFKTARGHKKEGLTGKEVRKVRRYIQTIDKVEKKLKLAAMFALLTNEGLRQMEVQQLKVSDLSLKGENPSIMIKRKGEDDQERFLITQATAEIVGEYLEMANPETYLFEGRKEGEPMTLRGIRKQFTDSKYGIFPKVGIKKKTTHGLRHYNITKTLQIFNGDLSKTRNRSGHKSFDMLIVYNDSRTSHEDITQLNNFFSEEE